MIFGLGSWQPRRIGLRDWLAEQLMRDHPFLAAAGPTTGRWPPRSWTPARVLPVLDGFDEIAAGLHRPALVALNTTTLPLLLTSRVDEYRDAVDGTDVLTSAAGGAARRPDVRPTWPTTCPAPRAAGRTSGSRCSTSVAAPVVRSPRC